MKCACYWEAGATSAMTTALQVGRSAQMCRSEVAQVEEEHPSILRCFVPVVESRATQSALATRGGDTAVTGGARAGVGLQGHNQDGQELHPSGI